MAWTAPRTWVASEVVTKALMDTHVRDNLNALHDGSLALSSQANGDWLQASSATAIARVLPYTPYVSISTTAVGNVGSGEDDLMSYAVAAGLLGTDGWGLEILAGFLAAANANSKTFKLYFGATVIATTGAISPNAKGVTMRAVVIRTGATAQVAMSQSNCEVTNGAYSSFTTPAETLANSITIKGTGAATSNDDIIQKLLMVRLVHTPT